MKSNGGVESAQAFGALRTSQPEGYRGTGGHDTSVIVAMAVM